MGLGDSRESAPVRRFVPAWLRAPQGVFPGVLALELVLARTEKVAIAIPRVYGYPEGFEIELRVISGADGAELDSRLYRAGRAGHLDLDDRGLPPPEMLRFAVEFADGSRVTNTMPVAKDLHVKPDGPVMHAQGGGGGAGNWRQFLWVWPLPPAGALTFVCEWPALRHSCHAAHARRPGHPRRRRPSRGPVPSRGPAAPAVATRPRSTHPQPAIRLLDTRPRQGHWLLNRSSSGSDCTRPMH